MKLLLVLLMLPALFTTIAYGQEQDTEENDTAGGKRLETVVVQDTLLPPLSVPDRRLTDSEALRRMIDSTPGGVGFVDETQIVESRALNFKDVLDYIPGVLVRPRFGDETQINIRGSGLRNNFHLRGINLLLDGFIYGSADGFSDFESIEPLAVERIEVFKGANSLRFGGNTLGGAINFITKTGYSAGALEARSEVGSFGFIKNYLGTGQVYGPFDAYVGLTDTHIFEGYREHSKQARERIYSTFGYETDGGTAYRLDLNYVRNEEKLPGALTFEEYKQNPRQANPDSVLYDEARNYNYYRAAFSVLTPIRDNQALEFLTQFNFQDMDHPLSFAVIDQNTYNMGAELRYLLDNDFGGRLNHLVMGAQFFYTYQDDYNFANELGKRGTRTKDQVNESLVLAYYLEDQFFVHPTFSLIGGGRLQYSWRSVDDRFITEEDGDASGDADFFAATPKLGFIWQMSETAQLFGNVSGSYEPPIMVELTSPVEIGGDLDDLKAQKAVQFELGTRGTVWNGRFLWDVSVYDYEIWDEIQNVNVQPFPDAPFTIPRYQNIDRTRHFGVEVGANVILLQNMLAGRGGDGPGDTLTSINAYTYSYFVFVDDPVFGDNDLPGAPPHFIRSELRYDHPVGVWFAPNIESTPEGYYMNSENTVKAGSYTIFNIQGGYNFMDGDVVFFAQVTNIFDKNYISSVVVDDANGRYFYPGDGRAFYAGVQWSWYKGGLKEADKSGLPPNM